MPRVTITYVVVWHGAMDTPYGRGSLMQMLVPHKPDPEWGVCEAARSGKGLGTLRRDLNRAGFRRPPQAMTVCPHRRRDGV